MWAKRTRKEKESEDGRRCICSYVLFSILFCRTDHFVFGLCFFISLAVMKHLCTSYLVTIKSNFMSELCCSFQFLLVLYCIYFK